VLYNIKTLHRIAKYIEVVLVYYNIFTYCVLNYINKQYLYLP